MKTFKLNTIIKRLLFLKLDKTSDNKLKIQKLQQSMSDEINKNK